MGNKAKRPGTGLSELAVQTATSAPAMLAAMVHDAGGAVSISFDVLAEVADELLLNVAVTPEGMQLTTTLKPIVRPALEVPEGPAGIADLGQSVPASEYDGWDYPGSEGEGVEPVAGEADPDDPQ